MRGFFYCAEQPIWEGIDEWAHFSYIENLATTGKIPGRSDPVPADVLASVQELRMPRGQSQDPSDYNQYEAQQPPLYYWLMAVPHGLAATQPVSYRVIFLRLLSMGIASLSIPFGYIAARRALCNERLGLFVPIAMACLPGLMIDVCRVANDSLAMVLTSMLLVILSGAMGTGMWIVAGVLLGFLLLTKAFSLVFLGLIPLVVLAQDPKDRKRAMTGGVLCVALALALSAWWYWHAWITTGTISGEQIDAAASRFSALEKFEAIFRIDWRRVVDSAAFTHIWIGGWSFLVLRSWMYRVFEAVGLCAMCGLFAAIWKRSFEKRIALAAAQYGLFCAAVAYHVVVIYLADRIPTALGWYFYIVVAAELILILFGLQCLVGKRWITAVAAVVICLTLCLDLYAMNWVLIPYHSNTPLGWLWLAYLAASAFLAMLALWIARENETNFPRQTNV